MRFGIDTGGTFTDLVVEDAGGDVRVYKTATTPQDPVQGVLDVLETASRDMGLDRKSLLAEGELLVHGTTRATNAILTKTTARTAFLTTKGHPDVLLFREGGRTDIFNWARPYPEPYVPRSLTYQVPERIGADGEIVLPLDRAAVIEIIEKLAEARVEAVAVCLLWSTVNPRHELEIGELLERYLPAVPHTLSHVVNPTIREYRRASATAIDASLKPVMSDYLRSLRDRLHDAGFSPEGRVLLVTSSGGMVDVADMAEKPILSIGSGPAMAPVAGREYARIDAAAETVVVSDAGGTSYDVSVVRRGQIPFTRETWLGAPHFGHMTGFPSIDVRSIGAGGGSLAWVDPGGLLHVGPESAGADPGPVCYGRGGAQPTVTDAALVAGYIDPDYFLGGAMRLDVEAARRALDDEIARKLGIGLEDAAAAVLKVVTENMARAIEEITVNQGIDPRTAVLVGGGGAAGLNAVAIARRLGCSRVVIPEVAAALSAAGALMSDLSADYAVTLLTTSNDFDFGGVNGALSELADRCRQFSEGSGAGTRESRVEYSVEARYLGQTWEIPVSLRVSRFSSPADVEDLRQDFHAVHAEIFAVADPSSPIEMVTWHGRVSCRLRDAVIPQISPALGTVGLSRRGPIERRVYFPDTGFVHANILLVDDLQPGERFIGPAIIESPVTTVVLEPGASAERAPSGSLSIFPWPESGRETRAREEDREPMREDVGMRHAVPSSLDGVQMAVLSNRFEGIVRAMINTLFRTSRSGVLATARDLSCAVVTKDCEFLAAAESLPIHVIGGADLAAKAMQELHPELRRGDAFLHNSPYHGNTHPADHSIIVPVFDDEGVHHFTAFTKAHVADSGNARPTTYSSSARDVYEEGALIFPCVKIQEDYRDCEDIIRMCKARLRMPEQWWGDYLGQIGAARIGERLLLELGKEYGWETLGEFARQWFDYSEQLMIEAIRNLPSGRVTTRTAHDPFPGVPNGIPLQATVEVKSEEGLIEVDLCDNPDCQPCGFNMTEAYAQGAARIAVFNSLHRPVPPNSGSFRRIKLHVRENCVAGIPRHPASCSSGMSLTDRVINAIQRGIADLGEGLGMAEAGLNMPPAFGVISGNDPRQGGSPFIGHVILPALTGGAGTPLTDGWLLNAVPVVSGAVLRDSVEIDERRHPIRIEAQYIIPDSEGAGRFRGAPGAYVEYGPVGCTLEVMYTSDGNVNPALGVRGGLPGARARQYKRDLAGRLIEVGPERATLEPGERIISISCGGGGYGPPIERGPQRVRHDVIEGLITRERAEAVYGVVLTDAGDVDRSATERLRARLRREAAGDAARADASTGP